MSCKVFRFRYELGIRSRSWLKLAVIKIKRLSDGERVRATQTNLFHLHRLLHGQLSSTLYGRLDHSSLGTRSSRPTGPPGQAKFRIERICQRIRKRPPYPPNPPTPLSPPGLTLPLPPPRRRATRGASATRRACGVSASQPGAQARGRRPSVAVLEEAPQAHRVRGSAQ